MRFIKSLLFSLLILLVIFGINSQAVSAVKLNPDFNPGLDYELNIDDNWNIKIIISDSNSYQEVLQIGDKNFSSIFQTGENSEARITQEGSGNQAVINQKSASGADSNSDEDIDNNSNGGDDNKEDD